MASQQSASPSERIAASYKQLSATAVELNAASDELGKSISALDAALKKLNLGISAWVQVAGDHDHGTGEFWSRHLGYAKVGGRWGIAISDAAGNYGSPPPDKEEEWLFNDAPRAFRIEAVEKLPDLLERLIQEAHETTKSIREKSVQAQDLAIAISNLAEPEKRNK